MTSRGNFTSPRICPKPCHPRKITMQPTLQLASAVLHVYMPATARSDGVFCSGFAAPGVAALRTR